MSSILVTLDYELFFGQKVGTVGKCLTEPTQALLDALQFSDIRIVLFVDAGYLLRLREFADTHPQLLEDYEQIKAQLVDMKSKGHDVQLHIHPHWEDSFFDGHKWHIDTTRYKLHDFNTGEIHDIVKRYKRALTDIVGDSVFAYRAGGWCLQPFEQIAEALYDNGIWLDSTVYYQGVSDDEQRWFDFRQAPRKMKWRFELDPCTEQADGRFLEVPISACRVSPVFFWKMAYTKKFGGEEHRAFGDGSAMSYGKSYYIERLTTASHSVASIDGYKASLLETAFNQSRRDGGAIFNVMGHPKSLTPFSIKMFRCFLERHPDLVSLTFQDFSEQRFQS